MPGSRSGSIFFIQSLGEEPAVPPAAEHDDPAICGGREWAHAGADLQEAPNRFDSAAPNRFGSLVPPVVPFYQLSWGGFPC